MKTITRVILRHIDIELSKILSDALIEPNNNGNTVCHYRNRINNLINEVKSIREETARLS